MISGVTLFTLRTAAVDTVKLLEWCTALNPAQAIPAKHLDRTRFSERYCCARPLPKVGSPTISARYHNLLHRGSKDFRCRGTENDRPAPPAAL